MPSTTAFMFGYWGWGSSTGLLLDVTAEVERARGFEPPCFVDVRVSRSVRPAGFREDAFEKLAGPDRYVWMPQLGNKRVVEHGTGIEIVEPAAAEGLLDLILAGAVKKQRVLFFCACEYPGPAAHPTCHRREVGNLLLKAARRRGVALDVGEWPGSKPAEVTVDVAAGDLRKLVRGAKSLTVRLSASEAGGIAWGSVVTARSGDDIYSCPAPPAALAASGSVGDGACVA